VPTPRKTRRDHAVDEPAVQARLPLLNNTDRREIAMLEKRLWEAADELRANSRLKPSEYSLPVLGLIFLRYADAKFTHATRKFEQQGYDPHELDSGIYHEHGVLYVPEHARFSALLALTEGDKIGQAVNDAMRGIEDQNSRMKDVLPKTYNRLDNTLLISLLKNFASLPDIEGDAFGTIYQYFLSEFAKKEGQKGGEFFTPISIVRLIVEVIEPYHGRILDPACGSGGMFVHSAEFVSAHQRDPIDEISIYGVEKVAATRKLCQMNLAIHGIEGDVKEGNAYYEDPHSSVSKFDFVMANPPFNVDGVDKSRLSIGKGTRFPFGTPKGNANYLWTQLFYSALNERGRAGFVMANSAGDARGTELEIRKQLIQAGVVDVMIAVGSNFFYTVTLPCTLWFFDRGKAVTPRKDMVLFLDARSTYRQIDRAHREFTRQQIEFLANIVRLYRGVAPETGQCSAELMQQHFPDGAYRDVLGLCRVATLSDIEAQGWSLNPGRYVGVAAYPVDEFIFAERLEELNEELEQLNAEARVLEERIAQNVAALLEQHTVVDE
jgi:type I restriction enzyme M protein